MKRLALIATLSASPVFAQNINVFVVEDSSNGVVQLESAVTLNEAAILAKNDPPAGTTGIILDQNNRTVTWTNETPQEVNERLGGDGEPYIEDRRDTADEDDMEFDADEEDRRRRSNAVDEDDMEFNAKEEERRRAADDRDLSDMDFEEQEDFFPEPDTMQSARIQPRDGYWAMEIRNQTLTGCPSGIESALSSQMAAINMSGGRGIFGPGFTPQKMAPQLEWTRVGGNSWLGSLDMSGDGSGAFMQWGVQVISPTRIDHRQQLSFGMGGLGLCEAYTFVTTYHVND